MNCLRSLVTPRICMVSVPRILCLIWFHYSSKSVLKFVVPGKCFILGHAGKNSSVLLCLFCLTLWPVQVFSFLRKRWCMTWPQLSYGSTRGLGGQRNSFISQGHFYLVNILMCAVNLCLRITWFLHLPHDPLGWLPWSPTRGLLFQDRVLRSCSNRSSLPPTTAMPEIKKKKKLSKSI